MEKVLHSIASLLSNEGKRTIIGISGHGASGKTTFAHNLIKLFGHDVVNYINTDPYIVDADLRKYTTIHYDYKNAHRHDKMTACHPASHHIVALERDINMIRDGLDFYTIGTNYSKSTLISSQNKINIVEGMSVAFTDLNLYDLKVYLYTDGGTELLRRGIRDVSERGADINYLRTSHQERRIQYDLFMHPYHKKFDIVLKNSNEQCHLEKYCLETYEKLTTKQRE